MTKIKLNKKYKYAGDIFRKLIDIGFDIETATEDDVARKVQFGI